MPPILFGTSCLGNLYQALPWVEKLAILRGFRDEVAPPVVLDSAGKYGAGLALECIGRGLRELGVAPEDVLISNKLGWLRTPLTTPEPTFEPGAWVGLEHDAEQRIGYEGILACWEQGCALLGAYRPRLASVHDPDEYLGKAKTPAERRARFRDVREAYRALAELRAAGEVAGVGVGAKDWRVIAELADAVALDWVMFACSMTVYHHPPELLAFMKRLADAGVAMVNSAVFHAGFLTGGSYFDYQRLDPADPTHRSRFAWREQFFELCRRFNVAPAAVCVQFGLAVPGVQAVALNTSRPQRVAENVELVRTVVPAAFWTAMKDAGLLARDFPYLG